MQDGSRWHLILLRQGSAANQRKLNTVPLPVLAWCPSTALQMWIQSLVYTRTDTQMDKYAHMQLCLTRQIKAGLKTIALIKNGSNNYVQCKNSTERTRVQHHLDWNQFTWRTMCRIPFLGTCSSILSNQPHLQNVTPHVFCIVFQEAGERKGTKARLHVTRVDVQVVWYSKCPIYPRREILSLLACPLL